MVCVCMCVGRIRSACLVLADLASVDVDEAKHLCKQFMANESPTNDTPSLELLTSKQNMLFFPDSHQIGNLLFIVWHYGPALVHTHTQKLPIPRGLRSPVWILLQLLSALFEILWCDKVGVEDLNMIRLTRVMRPISLQWLGIPRCYF